MTPYTDPFLLSKTICGSWFQFQRRPEFLVKVKKSTHWQQVGLVTVCVTGGHLKEPETYTVYIF